MKSRRNFLLALCVALSFPGVAQAAELETAASSEINNVNVLNLAMNDNILTDATKIRAYTNEIMNMSDADFDKMIVELAKTTNDIEELTKRLELCGVELYSSKNDNELSTMSLKDTEVNFDFYTTRRSNESKYHLITDMTFDSQELYPGSLDCLVLFFDPDLATYSETVPVTEDAFTIKSISTSKSGAVSLNFHDELICGVGYRDNYTAAVYVVPKKSGEKIVFGAELGHSYTETDIDISGSVSFETPFTFGVEIEFDPEQGEELWQVGGDWDFTPTK